MVNHGLREHLLMGETELKGPGNKGEVLGSAVHLECNPSCWGRGILSRNYFKHFFCFLLKFEHWTKTF